MLGSAAHADVMIGPFDTQVYLVNSGSTRFLPLMESPTSGQSIPFLNDETQFVGSSMLIGDNLQIFTNSSQLTVGPLELNIDIFTMNHTNMFPQNVTFPDGTPANNFLWVVGGALADRDGSIENLEPFPSAPATNILNGSVHVFDTNGNLANSVKFTGSPFAPNANFQFTCCGGESESIGEIDVTLDVEPASVPEPSTITLLSLAILCTAAYGWRRSPRV
jgi:hypothetical protein